MRRSWPLIVAILLAALTLAAAWPGIAMYDTVAQFGQVLSGQYDDWHPPAMARLWAGLHRAVGGAAQPMLVVQVMLYWLGLGLIAGALARADRRKAAFAVLACGVLPVFLVWQIAVLKDAQMLGAMLAGVGLMAWWRFDGRRVPWWGWALAALCFGYATLVRANAVFAVAPLVAMLVATRWRMRAALGGAMVLATLAAMPIVNQSIFGAEESGVRTTQPRYDLAGIAVRVADPTATRLGAAQVAALKRGHCVKPFFWDPLGDGACADAEAPLNDLTAGQLYATLAEAIMHHPFAYSAHRLAHLNSTERWLVPTGWPDAWPPDVAEGNAIGLANPGRPAAWLVNETAPLGETPLAWPIVWLALAMVTAIVALRRPRSPLRDLALALLVSGLALEASFAAISIASDLRYHLWPMMAAALASVLVLADGAPSKRAVQLGGAALAFVVVSAVASRIILPPAPDTYAGMLAY
ncbi:hypothetical protein [Sphingomonas panacisoli]|uniref:hypothetical protein n=1 Tax=Sphingomonas panacisoli TaxID=1813879 RepID=UPI001F00B29F|nr:hypothetical protein [Sphingomonas panacisoli]